MDKPVNGRPAVTHVAVRERFGTRATLVACRLETGRTHQNPPARAGRRDIR